MSIQFMVGNVDLKLKFNLFLTKFGIAREALSGPGSRQPRIVASPDGNLAMSVHFSKGRECFSLVRSAPVTRSETPIRT
jgi:hypothetical protein